MRYKSCFKRLWNRAEQLELGDIVSIRSIGKQLDPRLEDIDRAYSQVHLFV